MERLWTRRGVLAGGALLPLAARAGDEPEGLIAQTEKRAGGRLGVAAIDTQNGRRILHRAGERFPMCSTFKLLLAARILQKVDRGEEQLGRRIPFGESDLLEYAPVTRKRAGEGGMRVDDLAAAAIEWSDNTAANLLLASIGGPSAYTRFVRSLGDGETRLDRNEPALNASVPGDPRDTTTPQAMADDLNRVLLGSVLSPASRMLLVRWMIDCRTAEKRIPAGLPAKWESGNKTGTGENGSTNDIAILWPPGRKPVLLAVYYTGSHGEFGAREAVIADVARIVGRTIQPV